MEDFIDQMPDGPIKKWYLEHTKSDWLFNVAEYAIPNNFSFDPKSGLFFRNKFSEENQEEIGHTSIDIILPRPTDLHYHEDIDELIYLELGEGTLYIGNNIENLEEKLMLPFIGNQFFIEQKKVHAFRPNRGNFLEIHLECSGILNPNKEICVEKFDQFQPFVDYYSS